MHITDVRDHFVYKRLPEGEEGKQQQERFREVDDALHRLLTQVMDALPVNPDGTLPHESQLAIDELSSTRMRINAAIANSLPNQCRQFNSDLPIIAPVSHLG